MGLITNLAVARTAAKDGMLRVQIQGARQLNSAAAGELALPAQSEADLETLSAHSICGHAV